MGTNLGHAMAVAQLVEHLRCPVSQGGQWLVHACMSEINFSVKDPLRLEMTRIYFGGLFYCEVWAEFFEVMEILRKMAQLKYFPERNTFFILKIKKTPQV